jgi:hypothetical protein
MGMIKILGVKIVKFVLNDALCSDVVSFNPTCRWCVNGVVVLWSERDTTNHVSTFVFL